MDRIYLFFSDKTKLFDLPILGYQFTNGEYVYIHKVLGDSLLNWNKLFSEEEIINEITRLKETYNYPDDEFVSFDYLMERLYQYESIPTNINEVIL